VDENRPQVIVDELKLKDIGEIGEWEKREAGKLGR